MPYNDLDFFSEEAGDVDEEEKRRAVMEYLQSKQGAPAAVAPTEEMAAPAVLPTEPSDTERQQAVRDYIKKRIEERRGREEEINKIGSGWVSSIGKGLAAVGDAGTQGDFLKTSLAGDESRRKSAMEGLNKEADLEKEGLESFSKVSVAQQKAQQDLSKEQWDKLQDLSKEYLTRRGVQEFEAIAPQYRNVLQTAKSTGIQANKGLLMAYMKMVSPSVRVGEDGYLDAESSASIGTRFVSLYNDLVNGKDLPPSVKKQIVDSARDIYKGRLQDIKPIREDTERRAREAGIDPRALPGDFGRDIEGGGEVGGGVSARDKKALQWAKEHPEDPRSEEILRELGGK
jgi:hypothetical protein